MAKFPDKVALGKQEYKYDPRTVVMGALLAAEPLAQPPGHFDYDHDKKAFPLELWGNDENGDCVFVMEANGLVRVERRETRRTIPINTDVVLGKYRALTGSQAPGDEHDQGYVILDALKDWRTNGWTVGKHTYKIAAFGELQKSDPTELRRGIYLLGGIYTGFGLPAYVEDLVRSGQKTWDIQNGPEAEPYSWGGHAMFAKRYDENGIYFLTWGEEVYLTNHFIARYCDEAWAIVDDLDNAQHKLDIESLKRILRSIADNVQ